jgi:hypothetical protein
MDRPSSPAFVSSGAAEMDAPSPRSPAFGGRSNFIGRYVSLLDKWASCSPHLSLSSPAVAVFVATKPDAAATALPWFRHKVKLLVVWGLCFIAGGCMAPFFILNTTMNFDPPSSSAAGIADRVLAGHFPTQDKAMAAVVIVRNATLDGSVLGEDGSGAALTAFSLGAQPDLSHPTSLRAFSSAVPGVSRLIFGWQLLVATTCMCWPIISAQRLCLPVPTPPNIDLAPRSAWRRRKPSCLWCRHCLTLLPVVSHR